MLCRAQLAELTSKMVRWRDRSIDLATGSIDLATGSIDLATGSIDLATGSIDLATGSIDLATGSVDLATRSHFSMPWGWVTAQAPELRAPEGMRPASPSSPSAAARAPLGAASWPLGHRLGGRGH